ncbi:DUF1382 family protein [Marinobacterium jannaschii]|uniref:DUF1382 family protein n=1 Tax=Marinobacterium jannaschii TaxID=64970 RepID=UPI000A9C9B7A|nr:DUF1382 family protein [Marinobacterium jannaschii]
MERANPVHMRQALEVVDGLKKSGVQFVALPVLNDADHAALIAQLQERLEKIAADTQAQ